MAEAVSPTKQGVLGMTRTIRTPLPPAALRSLQEEDDAEVMGEKRCILQEQWKQQQGW